MGVTGIFRFFLRRAVEILIAFLLIVFMPSVPPDAKFETPYKVTPSLPLKGKLALNEKLNNVEIWHKGDLFGPEAFADFNGELYTTVHGGDVVKLTGNHITPIVKFGKPCKGIYQEELCGRPLGLNFDKNGALFVSDAYYGIYKVDVKTGKALQLVSLKNEVEGKKPKLSNSLAIANNGDIYWTDSSTEFKLHDGIFDMFADGSGRLIHYDAKTKKNTVLIDKLHFANGVMLSDDESFVIVAETARSRIHRFYLKGPKKSTSDIFVDGLPGLPDNLKSDGGNGFLIPLVVARDADHPSAFQIFGSFPIIRKFIARIFGLIELGFKVTNQIYPNEVSERGVHWVGHFTMLGEIFYPSRTTILHVSKTGEILDSIHALNKKISGISEAHIFKDTLYLGSPFNDYIARIPLAKVGWQNLATQKLKATSTTPPKKETTPTTPKPTTQAPTTPKPTTQAPTTPKPTTTLKPTTQAPTTQKPTTQAPTTSKPITQAPTTPKPTTQTPTTPKPTTQTPTTPKPITQAPTTKPTTPKPAAAKSTQAPTTTQPPTKAPPPTTTTQEPLKTAQAAPQTAPKVPPVAQTIKDQPKAVPMKDVPK